ncbi:hypothetical protein IKF04_00575 [Candidatus Saccharibacteria bacterium]|nr:hypothetical protein [Candidatus Saccharibacteria bacterium]
MNLYISGIAGTGLGPLALMAKQAGMNVCGTDLAKGAIFDELVKAGVDVRVEPQDGEFLKEKLKDGADWFVYTSALKEDHPELVVARENGIKCTKRDELTEYLVEKLGLKMVAVAGTHGKTTTTAMIVWAALKCGLPVSYIVGTTLGFAPSGSYKPGDKYFVYEADEYDRNFLRYHPWLAVIPSVSYDHPDIYPTREEYNEAFSQFESQSRRVLKYDSERYTSVYDKKEVMSSERDEKRRVFLPSDFRLAGEARRIDASLAATAVLEMINDYNDGQIMTKCDAEMVIKAMDDFPGIGRRFERICEGVYSDYAHHPEEIAATLGVAFDEKRRLGKAGVVVVYQPHQNTRQHEVKDGYKNAFLGADKIFWLPTYLTRENESLRIITPNDFIGGLDNAERAEVAELDDELGEKLKEYLNDDYIVVLMTAGPADGWLREKFSK